MRTFLVWVAVGLLLGVALVAAQGATAAELDQGRQIFNDKCAPCHGQDGGGDGPMAMAFSPKPMDFKDPSFWQGNAAQKITDTVNNGKGQMIPVSLSDAEIKAVIDYMSHTFKP
jgi:high-affinity iron transporter